MKLYIKQAVFSIGEKFSVKDVDGQDIYYVEGSLFRIPKMFRIYDHHNELVATIEKELFHIMPHYVISTKDRELTVKQEFTFFKHQFSILGEPWTLKGDFFSHEYNIVEGSSPIMAISKKWISWGDTYELNIADEKDSLLCLAIVIIVDAVQANENTANQASHNN